MKTEELTEIRKGHSTQIAIRWDELDPNGHVNNKNFQGYLDEARMRAMRDWGFSMEKLKTQSFGPVILSIQLDFKREINYPETILIESDLFLKTATRAVFQQKIICQSNQMVSCNASTDWVILNLNSKRPAKFLEAIGLEKPV
ncbi:acyl-CoA thioesterase [Leptospira interrogans]|uniref:Acyl-CoA thioester hydrolase, YbgC/YbaW family n=4 Tax=Leptospira interrogans TaxID=173 RepID=A0AAQ1SRA1_LEPIR|nr:MULTISPECIES: acyl-CoA thioesterase [Leptospira]EMF45150.1 acyl-CoA thioester hydrolase, YbgC/YbaW family [Leptospira interrogans serovar Lora str. TE 1992]EMM93077.1 acyl-CoA thioester hydrolase, YbgC/YbaW family [Leptospira interrogans serovar Zanoni str. LT2156]KAA1263924.1 acyl-CoA thioesterase [Leptospira interrogans serovar Weerasinghe]KAA1293820.1 acyl-CoA thioesterase [Leptospira interrogans serovar Geyaweera]AKH79226.1 acyl-CoA thioester hydrolase [Leptospira interrogans serovar Br